MNTSVNAGFLLINKPIGITSYGCIGYIKRIIKQKIKIGHAGTLDPFASGMLVVALGREATRLIDRIMLMRKTYIATGKCGELTDSLDHTGAIVSTINHIPSEQEICISLASFGSSYQQIPPLYSALKHQGYPLYTLARKKILDEEVLQDIAISKSRTIQLYDLQLLFYENPFFTIQVTVSQGTYIRTLINDIAMRAGSYATTYKLTRTAIGPFNLDQAVDLAFLNTIEDINRLIIPIETFIALTNNVK